MSELDTGQKKAIEGLERFIRSPKGVVCLVGVTGQRSLDKIIDHVADCARQRDISILPIDQFLLGEDLGTHTKSRAFLTAGNPFEFNALTSAIRRKVPGLSIEKVKALPKTKNEIHNLVDELRFAQESNYFADDYNYHNPFQLTSEEIIELSAGINPLIEVMTYLRAFEHGALLNIAPCLASRYFTSMFSPGMLTSGELNGYLRHNLPETIVSRMFQV